MPSKLRQLLASLLLIWFLVGNVGLTSQANAEAECISWGVNDDGEFTCTEWINTDPEPDPDSYEKPTGLALVSRTTSSIKVSWDSYESATGWVLEISSDNAETWRELVIQNPIANNGISLTDLKSASALWVRVAALVPTRTPFSDSLFVTTKGAKPVRATVLDSKGKPVVGGKITWRLTDNSAWSSKTYGLTSDGYNDFPAVPAGLVDVTIKDAITSDGALVSGSWRTTLGFDKTVLRLPSTEPSAHTIRVVLPNGLPVIGAQVSVPEAQPVYGEYGCLESRTDRVWVDTSYINEWGEYVTQGEYVDKVVCTKYGRPIIDYEGGTKIDSTRVVNGFTFVSPAGPYSGTTDVNGNFTIYGFLPDDVEATVTYDDGVITQQQVVTISKSINRVELEYLPWVAIDTPVVTINPNQSAPIELSINDAHIGGAFFRASVPKDPVKITIIPPKGAPKSTCKQVLSGSTNSKGKLTLRVCATKSGIYTIKTKGAVAVKTIRIQVKNSAPMPVSSVTAKSPTRGQVKVTWSSPVFDGKLPIKSYTITATAKGKKTITKTVAANQKTATLTGLSNATTYQISVVATNNRGSSDPSIVKVPTA